MSLRVSLSLLLLVVVVEDNDKDYDTATVPFLSSRFSSSGLCVPMDRMDTWMVLLLLLFSPLCVPIRRSSSVTNYYYYCTSPSSPCMYI